MGHALGLSISFGCSWWELIAWQQSSAGRGSEGGCKHSRVCVCCKRTGGVLCPGSREPPRASVLPTQADTVAAALSTPLKSECASCPVGWKGPWLLETVLRNTFL